VQLGIRWFDPQRAELRGPEGVVRLTGGEQALLVALAQRPNEVLSREDIGVALGTPEAGGARHRRAGDKAAPQGGARPAGTALRPDGAPPRLRAAARAMTVQLDMQP
jgi:hypothetical protein